MSMRWMVHVWTVIFCLWALQSHAAVLDPWAFTSLGTLTASETISINTDTLELTGGASYSGLLDPVSGAGIFAFDNITGTNLSIFGTRTLGLLSRGNIAFTGTIDLLGSGGIGHGGFGVYDPRKYTDRRRWRGGVSYRESDQCRGNC